MAPLYITTPIYYVNGNPHIGHAHTSIMGDILKRTGLMRGIETFYSTGTDEHGQKNQEAIEESGLDADSYLTRQSDRFKSLFDRLDVSYDFFARTTRPGHKEVVSRMLADLHSRELIYKKDYTGLYCVGCEQFKKESDLDDQGRCPDHLKPPVRQTETNYFFKISLYQDWLIDLLKQDDILIQPGFYRNEVLAMLDEPLEDLCISRPKTRVTLGIELPFDTEYVTYVWFDALINYISNIQYGENPDFDKWWDNCTHIMAKDIIKTHIIYWPIMLHAIGIKAPHRYRIHGYWVGEGGQKMAKSLGNVVEPNEVIDLVGTDGLRYYLAKSMGGTDSPISIKLITACYNTDLANNIGNLHSRVVKFVKKRCGGIIPEPVKLFDEDTKLQDEIADIARRSLDSIDLTTIPDLVSNALVIADKLNLHFNDTAPWKLVKDESQADRLNSVLYVMLDSLRLFFELLYPVIPETCTLALESLGAKPIVTSAKKHDFVPGLLVKGTELVDSKDLFPRIDVK